MGVSALRFPSTMDLTAFRRALWSAGITHLYQREENTQVIVLMDPKRYPDAIQLLGESTTVSDREATSNTRVDPEPAHTLRPTHPIDQSRHYSSTLTRWTQFIQQGFTQSPVTCGIITLCVLVFLWLEVAPNQVLTTLGFAPQWKAMTFLQAWSSGIGVGQIWRLFTPAIIHFNLMHIVFDLIWVWYLGHEIEKQERSWVLIFLVVIGAAISNTMQCATLGPLFGGMSGVVYAMFGFTWLTNHLKHEEIYRVPDSLMLIMVLWLVLGMTPIMTSWTGPIASVAHLSGLAFGLLCAFFKNLKKG
ncbi:Rhomboid protease GlpG [Halomonadaceae bacterium LMG 33818]|uniref:rhomboid family intramembrane serine protease n=1 Tax=Cernens ardua TaxID=3402176 RepID=UPI003EDC92AD